MSNRILAPISIGELLDKISILEIKLANTKDADKLKNIQTELTELKELQPELSSRSHELYVQLKIVNTDLWDIEDFKRKCEKEHDFGPAFIRAARNVYIKNDYRAQIKREINLDMGSHIIEEKIY